MRKRFLFLGFVIIIAALFVGLHQHNRLKQSATTNATSSQTTPADFNKAQYSLTDPTSIWVVVNKHRPLNPKTYAPNDLVVPNVALRVPGNQSMEVRRVTATALEALFTAAIAHKTPLRLSSGYRAYGYQVSLYNGYVKTQGQSVADSQSARPGYSEHQTGLAADLSPLDRSCDVAQCFGKTPAGVWLAANAYKYGFIIRYGQGLQNITGYEYEPWHVRYVGVALATEMYTTNIPTLEQFFNLGPAANYE